MRAYAEFESNAHNAGSGAGLFYNLIRNWQAHRAIRRMAEFDDHMLRDIGLTREDVSWASRLPLHTNAALALEERGRERRWSTTGV